MSRVGQRLIAAAKSAWAALDKVPNCPSCGGTGEAANSHYPELVWWKGQQVWVCGQCKGAGKV